MEMVVTLDVHRTQTTFRSTDLGSGEVRRGRIPTGRGELREFLAPFRRRDAHVVVEATTGWRFVVEEVLAAGLAPHLAEPAETAAGRGPKRRAKTDHADCDNMTDLLLRGRLPESWIPPQHILELRTLVRLRKDLVDQRTEWWQRIHAQLFHQGLPKSTISTLAGREALAEASLSPAGLQVVRTGLAVIEDLDRHLEPITHELSWFARHQAGCRALQQALYGVGELTATAILAELGDCRRFSSSDDAVRYAGLDITVYDSGGKRARGHLSRQGPEVLRWAVFEAAQSAARRSSLDHAYYLEVKARIDHNRACLAVARKLCRRAYHILRELGDEGLAPPQPAVRSRHRSVA